MHGIRTLLKPQVDNHIPSVGRDGVLVLFVSFSFAFVPDSVTYLLIYVIYNCHSPFCW